MKIRILSDLHLEMAPWVYKYQGEDVVVLAGDTATVRTQADMEALFATIPVPTVCVAGNHEFYHSDFDIRWAQLRATSVKFPHVHWLENQTFDLGNLRFLGSSLWTDFNLYGTPKESAQIATRYINDFRIIQHRGTQLLPSTLIEWNQCTRQFLHRELKPTQLQGQIPIVVQHWVPSAELIDPQYAGDPCNPYFTCSMDKFFKPRIPLWIHGHSHGCIDKVLNGTRHIRNTRGYPHEYIPWDPNLIVEV